MLKAIVFDFDGVIADSEPLHYRSFRDVLAPLGVALTESDYYARYLGFDDVGVFERVSADAGHAWTTERVEALVAEKARMMEVLERDVSVLFPGAADAVRRAASAVPLAIASGALRREIERVRTSGYSVANEELEPGYVAVGAPVRSVTGEIVAAISVGGLKSRFTSATIAAIAQRLPPLADAVSESLGWRAPGKRRQTAAGRKR